MKPTRAAAAVVTRRYLHIDGLAARLPRAVPAEIGALAGPGAISKNLVVRVPDAIDDLRMRAPALQRTGDEERITFESAASIGGAAEIAARAGAHPEAYTVNAGIHGVATLHAAGYAGEGVIVAVIDSGVRPDYPHLTSDGSIISGQDFVGDGLSYSSFINNGHGTCVAGMISANANLFGSAPNSMIMAGLDRAIELRLIHDRGEPGGVDIQVVNLSLGGATLYAGRDPFDMAVNRLFDAGIVVINSASNTGPSGLTIGSPGSAYNGINVGAASLVGNERVRRQFELGPGIAALLRQAFPAATARQIRNAVIMSADPAAIPGATINDQGAGLVNGQAAYDLLAAGLAPDTPPATPNPVKSVAANIERDGDVTVDTGTMARGTGFLRPAQRFELFYSVPPNTTRLVVTVADVTPSLPPAGQNGFCRLPPVVVRGLVELPRERCRHDRHRPGRRAVLRRRVTRRPGVADHLCPEAGHLAGAGHRLRAAHP
jgi:subtilisin family serine protease